MTLPLTSVVRSEHMCTGWRDRQQNFSAELVENVGWRIFYKAKNGKLAFTI